MTLYELMNEITEKNADINAILVARGSAGVSLSVSGFAHGALIFESDMKKLRADVTALGAESGGDDLPEWVELSPDRIAGFERITTQCVEAIKTDQELCADAPDLLYGASEILDTGDGLCLCAGGA